MKAHSWYIHSGEEMMIPITMASCRCRKNASNRPVT